MVAAHLKNVDTAPGCAISFLNKEGMQLI